MTLDKTALSGVTFRSLVPDRHSDLPVACIEALLPHLKLAGCIVTIDAMGCQTAIAAQVIERQGDYLLNAKDNQPKRSKNTSPLASNTPGKIWRPPVRKPR